MTFAVKREKVFALQDPSYPDCTPPRIKRSDHRLKNYPSIYDDRTWELSKERQYRALYELISGSQTCFIGADACHKYVPLEDLIRILMSEKDALIEKLEDELRRCCKGQGDQALKDEFDDSREMLRKAMHKLQNIDEIVNENKTLQCRLRCSEEKIKYLEEKRKCLESELEDLRSRSQIQIDLERAQEMLQEMTQTRAGPCGGKMDTLASERDQLQEKVKQLEKELEVSKKKEEEIQRLRESSKGVADKEEISMENECYKKKLASMRCLEKQIQELKKHGRALADKYKREVQKAAEQMNRMSEAAKELQALQKERDSLRKRVKELSSYESQYNALQCKLRSVEEVIVENEILHSKMVVLEKLEKENEYLKCRLNRIQDMENTAAEDKERIMQLQCAVADQEEEMKDLLCQIERLTSGTHQEELERLRCELYEKSSKLKLCEEQLAEIPMLEAEIDELRTKLQTCCREFPEQKTGKYRSQKIEVRLPAAKTGICAKYKLQDQESSLIKRKCEEKLGSKTELDDCEKKILGKQKEDLSEPCQSDKMTCEEVQSLLQSSKSIISCVLEDMMEHQKEMEELEKRNRAMKDEIEILKAKIETNAAGLQEMNDLRKALEDANKEICQLKESEGSGSLGEDVELLKDLNNQMKAELQAACEGLKQVSILEKKLEEEHRARCIAERELKRKAGESGILEPEDSNFDCCKALQKEVADLKLQIIELNKLTDELKKENNLLRELQKPCPDFSKELEEKCALENLLSLLQAELDAFKGQKLSNECEALRKELKRVMEQNCQLKALVDCYRQRLQLEKKSKELGGEILSEAEKTVDGKSPTVTPDKSAVPTFESGIPSPITPDKSVLPTPESGRLIPTTPSKSAVPTSESGRLIPTAPSKSAVTTTESGRLIPTTPSKSAVPTSESGRLIPKTPDKSAVPTFESGRPSPITPDKSILPTSESGRLIPTAPSKSAVTTTESGRLIPTTPSKSAVPTSESGRLIPKTPDKSAVPTFESGRPSPITPDKSILPTSESGRLIPTAPSKSAVTTTESGRLIPKSPSKSAVPTTESGRPMAMTPDKSAVPTTESGRLIPKSPSKSAVPTTESGRPMAMTPSKSAVPTSESGKSPIVTSSKSVIPTSEGGKTLAVTPSKSAVPTSEGGRPIAMTPSKSAVPTSEGGKPIVMTPSKSAVPTSEGGRPMAMTPSKSAVPTSEGGRPMAMTPSKSAVPTSESGRPMAMTPNKNAVPTSESGKSPIVTSSKSVIPTSEGGKTLAVTPSKSGLPIPEEGKSIIKTSSGRVAFTSDTVDKEKEILPSAEAGKHDQKVKSSPPAKDEKLESKVPLKAVTSQTAASQTDVIPSDLEHAKKEELLKTKEEGRKTPRDKSAEDEVEALRARLKQMEAENAEKLKTLMEQHEKELAHRDKVCNDNLNAMKAGYETDIRKLADRHKQGVMKLQGLHEDEVNELNTAYETQMEMMQTQSEAALNEVVKGSAVRLKKLAEEHTKELEGKNKELKKLQDGLTHSERQLETLKKKMESPTDAKTLQAKHSRELNAMKRGSQKKLSVLKEKFEDERKKSEIEIENLKKQIKGLVCDCKSRKKDRKPKDPCAPLDFIDVVEKILNQGLQALSFNEIALVHRKACCALEEMVMNSDVIPTLEPAVGDCCPHVPLIEADKQQLLKRIFTLENAIQEKQRRTQETIINMELAIKRERCRLMELKNMLINEQRRNSELQMVIQSQSQIQTNLKKERDELGNKASLHQSLFAEKSKQLDQEKQDKKSLEEELERLKMKVKQLCFALEMAREGPECQQNDQIEMLRIRLEQAQNQERKLAYQLQEEAKCRLQLQCQVQALRQSFKQMVSLPAIESQIRVPQNPLDAKCAKEMKNLDQLKEKKNKSKPTKKHKK